MLIPDQTRGRAEQSSAAFYKQLDTGNGAGVFAGNAEKRGSRAAALADYCRADWVSLIAQYAGVPTPIVQVVVAWLEK